MTAMMKKRQTLSLAVAAISLLPAIPAAAAPLSGVAQLNVDRSSAVTRTQGIYFGYGRGYRGYGGYYGPGPYYGGYVRPYYYAPPPPPPLPPVTYYETRPYASREGGYGDDAVARCASRFRSFNPRTGTYVTYDGEERLCPYLR